MMSKDIIKALEARFDKVDSKLDKLDEKVDNIDKHVVKLDMHVEKNTEDLEEHIRRTELAEARIAVNEEKHHQMERMISFSKGAFWVLTGLTAVILSIAKLFK